MIQLACNICSCRHRTLVAAVAELVVLDRDGNYLSRKPVRAQAASDRFTKSEQDLFCLTGVRHIAGQRRRVAISFTFRLLTQYW